MKLSLSEIPGLDAVGLRKFGFLLAGFFALIFGILLSFFKSELLIWPWVLVFGLIFWSVLHPISLSPIYKIWMIFAALMGNVISMVALFLIFFFLITPIGLLKRIGKTAEPQQSSWVNSLNQNKSNYEKPY